MLSGVSLILIALGLFLLAGLLVEYALFGPPALDAVLDAVPDGAARGSVPNRAHPARPAPVPQPRPQRQQASLRPADSPAPAARQPQPMWRNYIVDAPPAPYPASYATPSYASRRGAERAENGSAITGMDDSGDAFVVAPRHQVARVRVYTREYDREDKRGYQRNASPAAAPHALYPTVASPSRSIRVSPVPQVQVAAPPYPQQRAPHSQRRQHTQHTQQHTQQHKQHHVDKDHHSLRTGNSRYSRSQIREHASNGGYAPRYGDFDMLSNPYDGGASYDPQL